MSTPTEGRRPMADAAMPLPTFADGRPYTPMVSPETLTNAHVVELEMQATTEFTRDASAEVIRKLYRYVEPRRPQRTRRVSTTRRYRVHTRATAAG